MSEMPPSSYTPPPPPPPPPVGGTGSGGSDRGLMVFLAYFGLFALIPLLTKKDDPDIQWHAKNGLTLSIAWVVVAIGWQIVGIVLPLPIRLIWSTCGCFIGLAFLVLDILCMVKAFGGTRMRVPVITDMGEKMFGGI